MSDKKETDKKIETIRPGQKVEKSLLELLIHDLTIDKELITTFNENIAALQGWLAGIADIKVRETFRMFLTDAHAVMGGMAGQRRLMLEHLEKMEGQWQKMWRS